MAETLKDMLNEAISISELGDSGIYFMISLLLMTVYIWIFEKYFTRKLDDQKEIQKGNEAAARVLSAKRIGLVIIMAASLFENTNPLGVIIWGTIGFIVQVAVYHFVELKTPYNVEEELIKGNKAVADYLAGWSIAVSILVAFAAIIS